MTIKCAAAGRVFVLDGEDGAEELRLFGLLQALQLFFALCFQDLRERFALLADLLDHARVFLPAILLGHYGPPGAVSLPSPLRNSRRQIGAGLVKLVAARLGVADEQTIRVHDDLAGRVQFQVATVHGPRRRALEVDGFVVVTAAVTRALEFVFRSLPIRRASQMRAPRVDDEQPARDAVHPDAVFALKFGFHTQGKIRRITDRKDGFRLEENPRAEKTQEHQQIYAEVTID